MVCRLWLLEFGGNFLEDLFAKYFNRVMIGFMDKLFYLNQLYCCRIRMIKPGDGLVASW